MVARWCGNGAGYACHPEAPEHAQRRGATAQHDRRHAMPFNPCHVMHPASGPYGRPVRSAPRLASSHRKSRHQLIPYPPPRPYAGSATKFCAPLSRTAGPGETPWKGNRAATGDHRAMRAGGVPVHAARLSLTGHAAWPTAPTSSAWFPPGLNLAGGLGCCYSGSGR